MALFNRAELAAIFTALCTVPSNSSCIIYTDSQASIDGIEQIRRLNKSLRKWNKYSNKSLKWAIIHILESRNIKITFMKVKGHSGDEGNEAADLLAKKGLDSIHRLDIR